MDEEYCDRIASIGKALSDPCRVRILLNFRGRALSISAIVDELDTYQSNISYHIAILAKAGLVQRIDDGRWHLYALSEDAPAEIDGFLRRCYPSKRPQPF